MMDLIDTTLYVSKDAGIESELPLVAQLTQTLSITSSSNDSLASQETVIRRDSQCVNDIRSFKNTSGLYTLTQSPPESQQQQQHHQKEVTATNVVEAMDCQEYNGDSDEIIADILVQKLLDLFEV